MTEFLKSHRNRIKRAPKRALYDRETIYQILDEALICHIGFVEDKQPYVIPINFARFGDNLLLHGAKSSRLIKHIQTGNPVCVEVTLVDGLVLARSVFNHSVNYRSVVLYGTGQTVEEEQEKFTELEKKHAEQMAELEKQHKENPEATKQKAEEEAKAAEEAKKADDIKKSLGL